MKTIIFIFTLLLCYSCYDSDPGERKRIATLECVNKKSIDNIYIYFFGYTTIDADSIKLLQKRSGKIIDSLIVKIPTTIVDSLRHKRELSIKKEVLLTDTLILILKDERKLVYNYQYEVNNHNSMFHEDYGCDLMKVTVDGEVNDGAGIGFVKKGFSIMDLTRENYRQYYKEKNNSH